MMKFRKINRRMRDEVRSVKKERKKERITFQGKERKIMRKTERKYATKDKDEARNK